MGLNIEMHNRHGVVPGCGAAGSVSEEPQSGSERQNGRTYVKIPKSHSTSSETDCYIVFVTLLNSKGQANTLP